MDAIPTSKVCTACLRRKTLKSFHKDRTGLHGRRAKCRHCTSDGVPSASRPRNMMAELPLDVHQPLRDSRLRVKYGITLATYEQMVLDQEGRCLICLKPSVLVVDHCHETKLVRGLLCRRCNSGIGYFERDRSWVGAAVAYLDRFC